MWNVLNSATEPVTGCWWPIIEGSCSCTFETATANNADQMAAEILHALSGRQFGTCQVRRRPCVKGHCNTQMVQAPLGSRYVYPWTPWTLASSWSWVECSRCSPRRCSCGHVNEVTLPHLRIREVHEVMVDGVVLDPSTYRQSGRRLIRLDGAWPVCQDDNAADDEPGAWTVTYRHGKALPTGGRIATGVYACEIAKALEHRDECELPERVQTVSRQGVTIGYVDPMDFLDKGQTGVGVVDQWLNSVNPNKLRRRPGIYRVDAY